LDILKGVSPSTISFKFHTTIINLFSDFCLNISKKSGLNRVVLSGGVFQNSILLEGFIKGIKKRGLEVFTHIKVPSNDGGISLGQAVVAATMVETML